MDLTARTAVLNALDNFVSNYRMANGEQERARTNAWAYNFIETMTSDPIERTDFRRIYDDKIRTREQAMASAL